MSRILNDYLTFSMWKYSLLFFKKIIAKMTFGYPSSLGSIHHQYIIIINEYLLFNTKQLDLYIPTININKYYQLIEISITKQQSIFLHSSNNHKTALFTVISLSTLKFWILSKWRFFTFVYRFHTSFLKNHNFIISCIFVLSILTISLFLINEIISSLQKYKMSQLQQQSKQFLERKLYMEAIDTYLSQPNYVF